MIKTRENLRRLEVEKLLDYLHKNPKKNFKRAVEFAKLVSKSTYQAQIKAFEEVIKDETNIYNEYLMNLFENIDKEVLDTFVMNFILNASLFNGRAQEDLREKYNCNIPWAILLDPTTACNLKCTGCWAAEYGNGLNLSFEEIDGIISQGKELGIYFYIFTGGEPLVRKNDIIKLCEKHDDCEFLSFTNATLIDEDFAKEMLRVKNFVPAISIEGSEETTDSRRGKGTYKQVMRAMEILKANKLPFGLSCCYTSQNYDVVLSEGFIDDMIAKGALFAWYFHYMPVGNSAVSDLLLNPGQREYVYDKIRMHRKNKPIFLIDFQNDAEYVGGCIAGGRNYLHINANGDVEPCVFIHYSDSNIREKTLLEALQSPLFMQYHNNQPFNENMLRPCPMLENPEKLRTMVGESGAHSTDVLEKESVEHLCSKCDEYAKHWKTKADELWYESVECEANCKTNGERELEI